MTPRGPVFWGLGFPGEGLHHGGYTLTTQQLVRRRFHGRRPLGVAAVAVALDPHATDAAKLAQGLGIGAVTGAGMLQADALPIPGVDERLLDTGLRRLADHRHPSDLPPPPAVAVCALMVFRLAILSRVDPHTLALGRGEAETLGAAACFTIQILVVDAPGFAGNRNGPVSLVMFAGIALLVLPVAFFSARGMDDVATVVAARGSIANLAVATLLPTLGSFLLANRFQPNVTPSEAGVVYATEPVFASAFAMFAPEWLSSLSNIAYANERADSRLVLGGALVVGANLLLSLGARPEPKAA